MAAGLAVRLAAGGMPGGLERGFVAFLWGCAALAGAGALLAGATVAGVFGSLTPRAGPPAPARPGWRDVAVDAARAVLVLALLAAGRPALGAWFALCLIGFRLFFRWMGRRELPGRGGASARTLPP